MGNKDKVKDVLIDAGIEELDVYSKTSWTTKLGRKLRSLSKLAIKLLPILKNVSIEKKR